MHMPMHMHMHMSCSSDAQVGVKAAKVQYGIIVAGGQVGAIGGCTLVLTLKRFGVPWLCGLGAVLCALPLLSLRCLVRAVPPFASMRDGAAPTGGGVRSGRVRPGLFEGARLVLAYRYVQAGPLQLHRTRTRTRTQTRTQTRTRTRTRTRTFNPNPNVQAIFVCTSGYKVVATIMDYQMQVLVRGPNPTPNPTPNPNRNPHPDPHPDPNPNPNPNPNRNPHQVLVRGNSRSPDEYAAFMGLFGLATNSVSLAFSLLGK